MIIYIFLFIHAYKYFAKMSVFAIYGAKVVLFCHIWHILHTDKHKFVSTMRLIVSRTRKYAYLCTIYLYT